MSSGRFVTLCALGLAGSLFLGYCVYFDRKRRQDPDYKKKVLARELQTPRVTYCVCVWLSSSLQLKVNISCFSLIQEEGERKCRRR